MTTSASADDSRGRGNGGGRDRKPLIAGDLRGDLREFRDADFVVLAEHDRTEDRVFKLADIPGPSIGRKQAHRFGRNRAHLLAFLRRKTGDEAAHEIGQILHAVAQRRYRDGEDMQAVEQILAELAGADQLKQVAVGGGDQPEVDLHGLARSDRIDFSVLQCAQQFDLRVEGQFADLVEKEGAAVRFEKLSQRPFGRAGEGALLMAEQDRLDQIGRGWRRSSRQ
jgi:enoyl-CoA hydratase/carnithine racemase